jgi:hypothetical protein
MTKQEEIARFLDKNVAWPRMVSPHFGSAYGYPWVLQDPWIQQRPSAEELATELLTMAESQSLRLANFLATPQGTVFAEAVEMVAPPFYRQDAELLIEGLKLAASIQRQKGTKAAGVWALAFVIAAVVCAGFILPEGGKLA